MQQALGLWANIGLLSPASSRENGFVEEGTQISKGELCEGFGYPVEGSGVEKQDPVDVSGLYSVCHGEPRNVVEPV